MTGRDILSLLYTASGIASAAFYLPQLRMLAASPEARRGMSLAAWGGWLGTGVISLLYAMEVTNDVPMMAVTGANTACLVLVVAMAAGQRISDRKAIRSSTIPRPEPGTAPPYP